MRALIVLVLATLAQCAPMRSIVRADSASFATRLRAAGPGDVIALAPGTYEGGWWIDISGAPGRPVTITALAGPGTVIVEGGGEGINIADGAHDIVLSGLEIRGSSDNLVHVQGGAHDIVLRDLHVHHAGPDGDGIKVNQAHDILIERVDCHDPGPRPDRPDGNPSQECIDLVDVEHATIRDSYLHDGGNQLIFVKGGSRDIVIERNVITRQGPDAIDPCVGLGGATDVELLRGRAYEASDVVFRNNIVAGCRAGGVGVYDGEHVWIVNNTLSNVGTEAIEFRAGNGPAGESRDVHVVNNWFVDTTGEAFAPWSLRSHRLSGLDAHHNVASLNDGVSMESDAAILATLPSRLAMGITTLEPAWQPSMIRAWSERLPDGLIDQGTTLSGRGAVHDDVLRVSRPIGSGVDIGAIESRRVRSSQSPAPTVVSDVGTRPSACNRGCNRPRSMTGFAFLAFIAGARRRLSGAPDRRRVATRRTDT